MLSAIAIFGYGLDKNTQLYMRDFGAHVGGFPSVILAQLKRENRS